MLTPLVTCTLEVASPLAEIILAHVNLTIRHSMSISFTLIGLINVCHL